MRKATILLAAVFALAITSAAEAAKKKAAPAKAAADPNQNAINLVTDAFQPWRPTRPAPGQKAAKGGKKKG
jgi:hypothetical protein